MPIIAPSILAANFLQLQHDCEMVNDSQAGWFHLDVMDGRFVPNISFGFPIIEQIKKVATKPLDVHLMIVEPEKYIDAFHQVGADNLSIHIEACNHLHRNIQHIKNLGMKAGVAINPHTSVLLLDDVLADIDLVCMMSVNPGFGGQKFIPNTLHKISKLKDRIIQRNLNVLIEIDGGVTEKNAAEIVATGADVLVAGSTVFNSANPTETIAHLANL